MGDHFLGTSLQVAIMPTHMTFWVPDKMAQYLFLTIASDMRAFNLKNIVFIL